MQNTVYRHTVGFEGCFVRKSGRLVTKMSFYPAVLNPKKKSQKKEKQCMIMNEIIHDALCVEGRDLIVRRSAGFPGRDKLACPSPSSHSRSRLSDSTKQCFLLKPVSNEMILNLRTTTSQERGSILRRARISGTCVSLNSRLESQKRRRRRRER